jgi:hypothetical protein
MRLTRLIPISILFSLLATSGAAPQSQAPPQDPDLAERACRSAINSWSYGEYGRLYSMGTLQSRAALSERDFAEEMEKVGRKPGLYVTILEVRLAGPFALVKAEVRLEPGKVAPYHSGRPPIPRATEEIIQVTLTYQEGDWRINLHQFVGLSRY